MTDRPAYTSRLPDRGNAGPSDGRARRLLGPLLALALGAAPFVTHPGSAQVVSEGRATGASPPAVFLDCQSWRNCDSDQFRTEIDFVNWVNDREDSDVHVIFTSTGMSGGGRYYEIEFIGRGDYDGIQDQLTFTEAGEDVTAEVMDGLARTLRFGLARFAIEAGMANDLSLLYEGEAVDSDWDEGEAGPGEQQATADPWDLWTFQARLSGDVDLRETETSTELEPRFDADRVSETWKLNFSLRMDFERESRELSDGREVRDDRDDWRLSALVVRSVGANFSVGVDADLRNSIRRNQHARIRMNPAIEYNYYPYEQASRRQFIAHYTVGMEHSNYMEETVYGVTEETLPMHRLGVQYRAREEWGDAGLGMEGFQYLHQGDFYSFGVNGRMSYRIFRGLELNVSGSVSQRNDNIHTPADAIDDEDILLGRQRLPSAYRYEASLGFSYRFGSSQANIVNNRFPGSVRW